MGQKGRCYLRKLCQVLNKTGFDVAVFSSRIEVGVWRPAVYSPLDLLDVEPCKEILEDFDHQDIIQRFEQDRLNFNQVLDITTLISLYNNWE